MLLAKKVLVNKKKVVDESERILKENTANPQIEGHSKSMSFTK